MFYGLKRLERFAATGRKDRRRDLRPRRRPMSPNRSGGHCGVRDDDGDDACDAEAAAGVPCGDASAPGDVWGRAPFRVRVHRAERQST